MDIIKWVIYQDSGNIYPAQLIYLSSWMTSVWSMLVKKIPATS